MRNTFAASVLAVVGFASANAQTPGHMFVSTYFFAMPSLGSPQPAMFALCGMGLLALSLILRKSRALRVAAKA